MPRECCLVLRKYATSVVCLTSKDVKAAFRLKTVIPAAANFGKPVYHYHRNHHVQKSKIQLGSCIHEYFSAQQFAAIQGGEAMTFAIGAP